MSKMEQLVFNRLKVLCKGICIKRNARPDWLVWSKGCRLELDFYIEDIGIAVEVQGDQHYVFTPHFHRDMNGFLSQRERDEEKYKICKSFGVELLYVYDNVTLASVVERVSEVVSRPTPYHRMTKRTRRICNKLSKALRSGSSAKKRKLMTSAMQFVAAFYSNGYNVDRHLVKTLRDLIDELRQQILEMEDCNGSR